MCFRGVLLTNIPTIILQKDISTASISIFYILFTLGHSYLIENEDDMESTRDRDSDSSLTNFAKLLACSRQDLTYGVQEGRTNRQNSVRGPLLLHMINLHALFTPADSSVAIVLSDNY